MPFAGYENFAACVRDQMAKGHTEEEAKRICGYLESRVEEKRRQARDDGKKEDNKNR